MEESGGSVIGADQLAMDLVSRGSPEGLEMLYDRYAGLAYSLAHRIVGDASVAEDVVQESFLAVWRRAATYRPDRGGVRGWLCRVVHNRAIDRLRGRGAGRLVDLPLDDAEAEPGLSDTWLDVAAALERDQIKSALGDLPLEQRQTIELAYYAGYTQTEISDLMKVPLGTVKGRTRMALRKLRSTLEERDAELTR